VGTDERRRGGLTRLLAGGGLLLGVVMLLRPGRLVAAARCPEFPEQRLWVVRVLGARLVAQHAAVLFSADRRVVRAATAVDLLHAASMVPLVGSARYGRAARISGGIAAAYAAIGTALAPRSHG
jgi:hypothetical protein